MLVTMQNFHKQDIVACFQNKNYILSLQKTQKHNPKTTIDKNFLTFSKQ